MTTTQITRQGTTYQVGRRGTCQIAAEHIMADDTIRGIRVLSAERTGRFTSMSGTLVEVIEVTFDAKRGGFTDSRGWDRQDYFAVLGTAIEDEMYSIPNATASIDCRI